MRLDLFDADAKVGIGAKRAGGRPGGAQRIDETIKPTEQQKAAFDALKSASAKAASDLDASCPADMPEKLTDRLDMVAKRLDALADAVDTVKPALTDFYNTLSDEQKARFNVIGRAPDAVAPQREQDPAADDGPGKAGQSGVAAALFSEVEAPAGATLAIMLCSRPLPTIEL